MRPHREASAAFSLIEVVVAIGLFGTGVGTVIGVLGLTAKAVTASAETALAANLGDSLRAYLHSQVIHARSLDPVRALLWSGDGEPAHLFASRDGLSIGAGEDPVWRGSSAEKFFEIVLLPLSTAASPGDAVFLGYVAEIRWPVDPRQRASDLERPLVRLPGAIAR